VHSSLLPYSGSQFPYGGIIYLQHEVSSLFFPDSSDVSLQHEVLSLGFNRPKIHCYLNFYSFWLYINLFYSHFFEELFWVFIGIWRGDLGEENGNPP